MANTFIMTAKFRKFLILNLPRKNPTLSTRILYLISLTKLTSSNTPTKFPKFMSNEGLLVEESIHIGIDIQLAMSNKILGLKYS